MTSIFKRKGFTLIELMVVIAMIAVIAAAMTVSVSGARERAQIQKATVEVKSITQAVLAYENYSKDGELPVLGSGNSGAEVNASNLGFLMGKQGQDATGSRIPVLLQAALNSGGKVLDPWGTPYTIVIAKGSVYVQNVNQIRTGFALPNIHRLSEEERQ